MIKELSKMLPDENHPIAEDEVPKQNAPLSKEVLVAQMQRLTERAKAAGLSPIHTLVQTYIKQVRTIIEGLLDSLENEKSPKGRK